MKISRRHFLAASAGLSLSALAANNLKLFNLPNSAVKSYELIAKPFDLELMKDKTSQVWGYNNLSPGTVLRCKQGDTLKVRLVNQLEEQTTIHWHGMRVPLEMDGVPYLSQLPVLPGEYFNYEFKCVDAGNFWYHPHEGSTGQLGRGLYGAVIIDEAHPTDFTHEETLILKTWHLDAEGKFTPFYVKQNAAMEGTKGSFTTINSINVPTIELPANQIVRLRIFNVDNTITYKLKLTDIEAKIYSVDGQPLTKPWDLAAEGFLLAAGQRIDLAILTHHVKKQQLILTNNDDEQLAIFNVKANQKTNAAEKWPSPLPANPISIPDISKAETIVFNFGWVMGFLENPEQEAGYQFWQINDRAWDVQDITCVERPIATLKHNHHYIFELRNASPFEHPIHLHGLPFKVIASNKKEIIPHFADTYLLDGFETAKIALVADAVGTWMLHCHVLEHLEAGMMAAIKVV